MSRTPETKRTYCPHCDSNREPFFSRSEPMGFYCCDCGRDVDDKTTVSTPLYKAQEQQLNDARRERDEYKDLLIRVYDDLFVHRNMGEAVRDLKILMGAIQLTDALAAVKGGSDDN